jgi:UDP-glucose 4-epimerase
MASILVTGGAGYIGSIAARHLLDDGHDVIVVDNLCVGHREVVDARAAFVACDLNDKEALAAIFRQHKIAAVMHFAGLSLVGESVRQPLRYYENNVVGTLHLLEAMRHAGVGRLVFSSSAAIYGDPERVPISEDAPKRPTNPYGSTKVAIELLLRDYEQAYGLRSVSLRYFNAAGAAYGIGEWHEHETHLIPRILNAALEGTELTLYGDDYDTPDGSCVRDYVHVLDLAEAHRLAFLHLLKGGASRAFNLGSDRGSSVKEVIRLCDEVTGAPVRVKVAGRRTGDPARLVASSELICQELGWSATHGLRQIIGSAWAWHKALHGRTEARKSDS